MALKHKSLNELFDTLAEKFRRMNGRPQGATIQADTLVYGMTNMLGRFIVNDVAIPITGSKATDATCFDATYGIKLGYMPDGGVMLTAKGGTAASYEYLGFRFKEGSVIPDNITLTATPHASTSYLTSSPGKIQGCYLSGFDTRYKYKIEADVSTTDTKYDITYIDLTVTQLPNDSTTEITFTVDALPAFKCLENMTWFDFMNSPYEVDSETGHRHLFGSDGVYVYIYHPQYGTVAMRLAGQYLTSLIINGTHYTSESGSMTDITYNDNTLGNVEFYKTKYDTEWDWEE